MLLPQVIPLALLMSTAIAKPVFRAALPKRQDSDATIPEITQTSADSIRLAPTEARPLCSSIYIASEDQNCGDIATSHGVHLSQHLAGTSSTSYECRTALEENGVCCSGSTTIFPSDNSISSPATSAFSDTMSVGMQTSAASGANENAAQITTIVGVQNQVVTRFETTTMTFTLGAAGTSMSTFVVTKTITQLFEVTTTITIEPTKSAVAGDAIVDALITTPTPVTATIAAASCSAVAPPANAVLDAVVSGCTQWYTAVPGDFCYKVAEQFNVAVTIFMSWNPTINAPWCTNLLAGSAYCVATCENPGSVSGQSLGNAVLPSAPSPTLPAGVTSLTPSPTLAAGITSLTPSPTLPAGVTSLTPSPTLPAGVTTEPGLLSSAVSSSQVPLSSTPAGTGTNIYRSYLGDGSIAAGWPSENEWVDFDYMFSQNEPQMYASCAQWGVPDDTSDEIANMRSSILSVGSSSNIDPRFILAIIMQESTGCVRVITTAYSHPNPGLMQSHNGTGTCNTNMAPLNVPGVAGGGVVQTPCPASEIQQMISDGTEGTSQGDGLVQLFAQQGDAGAQGYYRTSRLYNGGSIASSGLLEDGCCTSSYASDVANRLTGWTTAPRSFSG